MRILKGSDDLKPQVLTWAVLVLAMLGTVAPDAFAVQNSDAGPPGLPIDRWLVSDPIALDSIDHTGDAKLLSGAGEFGVLPRRGREMAGTRWTLVRTADAEPLRLDSLTHYVVERSSATRFKAERDSVSASFAMFAHAYLRSPDDRNVVLRWQTANCLVTHVRLNGSRVHGRTIMHGDGPGIWIQGLRAEVRLAAGWNTVLVRVQVPEPGEMTPADCGLLDVRVLAAPEGTVDGIRVQASRPPGQVRTGPEPWVLVSRHVEPIPTWRADQVTMNVPVVLTSWSRAVLDSVRVRSRGPEIDLRTTLRDLHIGRPDTVLLRFPLKLLPKLEKPGAIRIETRWKDHRQEETLTLGAASLKSPRPGYVKMEGWMTGAPEEQEPGAAKPAVKPPEESGARVWGRWIVPDELAGSSLTLLTAGSAGDYRLNGEEPLETGRGFTLCQECSPGMVIEVSAVSAETWTALPMLGVQ